LKIEEKFSRCIKSHIGKCFILIPNHRHVMIWLCKSFPIKSKIIWWELWLLGVLAFSFSVFFFSLVRCGARADTKIWLVTKKVITSCIPRVLTKLLLLFPFFFLLTILHIVQTLSGTKKSLYLLYYFYLFIYFLFFFSSFLQSLIGWLSSFPFSFLFFWSTFITQGKRSIFFGRSFCSFFQW